MLPSDNTMDHLFALHWTSQCKSASDTMMLAAYASDQGHPGICKNPYSNQQLTNIGVLASCLANGHNRNQAK
jgi:hypothetical protein